ncbi:MAG: hypothetical protein EBR83_10545, partial [Verrucomicrobia bacterium]|nr:hypothetical protein [Verrucomicrobiota bacterium]
SVDAFFDFARAAGWKIIYGVNLGAKDPAMAADEAAYAWQVGAKEIIAIEIGNEPNLYPKGPKREGIRPNNWRYPQYKEEFTAVYDAIKAKDAKIPITGPAVTKSTNWMPLFMADFKDRIALATSHVYHLSAPEADPKAQRFTSVEKLLGEKYPDDWIIKLKDATSVGVPYRVGECNTASGGGKRGVSNAFVSALWAIDFMFDVAQAGGQGVNFHGSFTSNNYSPIVFDKKSSRYVPAPMYYGMLFFSRAAQGRLVATELKTDANFVTHSVLGADGKLRVTLVNKDLTKPIAASLAVGGKFAKGQVLRLTAPSIDATEGVTFAGATVNADGTWAPKTTEALTLSVGTATVTQSEPSIRGRTLYIPLNAWFTLDSRCAFPLISLQYNELTITVTLRPIQELFQVRDVTDTANDYPYIRPDFNNEAYRMYRFLQTPPDVRIDSVYQSLMGVYE